MQARAPAKSIIREIDKMHSTHAQQLATKVDVADARHAIIRWIIGSMLASVGLFAVITKT